MLEEVLGTLSDICVWMVCLDGISTWQRCLQSSFPFIPDNGA